MQGLLFQECLFLRHHIGHTARQPLVQLYLELRLQGFRICAGANPPDQIEPGLADILEARGCAVDQRFRRERQPEIGHIATVDLRPEEAGRGDTDHRERIAVNLVCLSDHRRIGSVLSLPGMETHHRDRRRAFLVVGIGE